VVREYGQRVAPEADPRGAPAAGAKRRQMMTAVVAANRAWDGPADPEVFRRGIAPRLETFKLSELMEVTGLTKGACSRIRAGPVVPHARHWAGLERLVNGKLA
jgi:hypothetical protein